MSDSTPDDPWLARHVRLARARQAFDTATRAWYACPDMRTPVAEKQATYMTMWYAEAAWRAQEYITHCADNWDLNRASIGDFEARSWIFYTDVAAQQEAKGMDYETWKAKVESDLETY